MQNIPTGGYLWSRDEEKLVDYEPEEPATFAPVEDDISVAGDDLSPPGDWQNTIFSTANDFPAHVAEDDHIYGGAEALLNVFEEGEHRRKPSSSIGVGSPHKKMIIHNAKKSDWIRREEKDPTQDEQRVAIL